MKVAIFGGGGFIGSTIVDLLLEQGHAVRIFERPRVPPYRRFADFEAVEWITGDFSSIHDVNNMVEGTNVVMHLVSTTLPKNSNEDPIYDIQSNVIATLQLLNAMVVHKVPKMIFISSGGTVYGNPLYLPVDEKHPTDPLVSYGITKLAIEKYLKIYHHLHGIESTILRVANPYGERQRIETAQGAVGVFLNKAIKGESIEIWGDGSVTRDYIHVSDVAKAFVYALSYSGGQHCFNVSSGVGTSLNELVRLIEQVLGRTVRVSYLPGRSFDVPVSVLDNNCARTKLGWQPAVSMQDGVVRTANWIRNELRRLEA